METVSLEAVQADLARFVERAAAGEEIVIEQAGQRLARLVPVKTREFDLLKGKVWIGPDFDDPLPVEMQRAFDGEDP